MKKLIFIFCTVAFLYAQNDNPYVDFDKKEIKEFLLKLEKENYKTDSSFKAGKFLIENLELLGNPDQELRDRLFLSAFFSWLYNGECTVDEINLLTDKVISSDFLFYKINTYDSVAVYKRTFSVLVVCGVVDYHTTKNIFSESKLKEIKSALLEYVKQEKNVEGYSRRYGWAHSAAHTSDAVLAFTQMTNLEKEDYSEFLNSLKILIIKNKKTYQHQEDNRIARAFYQIIKNKKIENPEMIKFINTMIEENQVNFTTVANFYETTNIFSFLKALYFFVENDNNNPEILKYLSETIKKQMRIIK